MDSGNKNGLEKSHKLVISAIVWCSGASVSKALFKKMMQETVGGQVG